MGDGGLLLGTSRYLAEAFLPSSRFPGAASHYFGLALSFWVMCFIANAYAVIVRERRAVFKQPIKIHFLQSVLCWLGPAIIVACCLFIAPPGYKFLFVDLLAAGSGSLQMAYFAVTLPMQVTLGVSLSLLWSIAWHLRKVPIEFVKVVLQGTISTKTGADNF